MQGVVVVQSLVGLGKTVPGQIPNTERAVGHDPHFGGVRQTVALGLGKSGSRDRFALVLNRYRKVGGFNEVETESAIGAPVLWRIPNQYFAVSAAIDRGVPLMQAGNTELARSIAGLAHHLTKDDLDVKRRAWSLFKTV